MLACEIMNTPTWTSLEGEALAVFRTTDAQAGSLCTIIRDAIGTMADGYLIPEITRSDAFDAQMGLFSQNLNSLKCSADLAFRGYYTQCLGLMRGVYENWIAFHYLRQFPMKAHLWLRSGQRPPGHSEMLRALGPDFPESKENAKEWYGVLCRMAHPDALIVLPHLGNQNGEPCAFIGAQYKEELFQTCGYTILSFSAIMIREVAQMIPTTSEWHNRGGEMFKKIRDFITQANADFMQSGQQRGSTYSSPAMGSDSGDL